MKRHVLLCTLALCSSILFAQDDVPAAAKDAFAGKFPGAKFIEWEDPEDGVYEVDFEQDGTDMMAKFDADGNWVETETEITETNLPEAVWQAITGQFAGYKIKKVETEEKAERPLAYKIQLEQEDSKMKVTFSADGEVLKKKEKSDD